MLPVHVPALCLRPRLSLVAGCLAAGVSILCGVPAPVPVQALALRLQQLSAGVTALKAEELLECFPTKRLLLRFVASFPTRDDLAAALEVCAVVAPGCACVCVRTCASSLVCLCCVPQRCMF